MSPSCLEAATACCLMRANNCSATGWSSSYAWSTIFCAAENCWCTHANFTAYSTYLWSRKHGLHYYNSQPKFFLRSSLPLKHLEHAIRILKLNFNCLRESKTAIHVLRNVSFLFKFSNTGQKIVIICSFLGGVVVMWIRFRFSVGCLRPAVIRDRYLSMTKKLTKKVPLFCPSLRTACSSLKSP